MTSSSKKEYNFPGLSEESVLYDRRYGEEVEVIRISEGQGPFGNTELVMFSEGEPDIGYGMRYRASRPLDLNRFEVPE